MESLRQRIEQCRSLTDARLTLELAAVVTRERESLIEVLLHVAEFGERDLARKKGYANLFDYVVKALKYSKAGAFRRIAAARAGQKFPVVLRMLATGDLSLVGVAMLADHLTKENHVKVLEAAKGKSQDQIAVFAASFAPGQRKRDTVRVVSAPPAIPVTSAFSLIAPPLVPPGKAGSSVLIAEPLLPAEVRQAVRRISFDACEDTFALIRRAQALLRHRFPKGDLDDVLRTALLEFLDKEDRDRHGRPIKPWRTARVTRGRYISESVKQAVWERDKGRCTFEGEGGHVCGSREWLEFDHRVPVALGGFSTVENVRLLCRGHNQLAGRMAFGGPEPSFVKAGATTTPASRRVLEGERAPPPA